MIRITITVIIFAIFLALYGCGAEKKNQQPNDSNITQFELNLIEFDEFLDNAILQNASNSDSFITKLIKALREHNVEPDNLGVSASPRDNPNQLVVHVYDMNLSLTFAIFIISKTEGRWVTEEILLDCTNEPIQL